MVLFFTKNKEECPKAQALFEKYHGHFLIIKMLKFVSKRLKLAGRSGKTVVNLAVGGAQAYGSFLLKNFNIFNLRMPSPLIT